MKREGPSKFQGILEMLFERSEEFPLSVKERMYYRVGRHLDELLQLAEICDSPIEFLLIDELAERIQSFNMRSHFTYEIHLHEPIIVNDQTYKVDFLIAPIGRIHNVEYPNLVIECDGHEYHEKTPEQATRDKRKDRVLQLAGYKILRFTGTEIYNSSSQCAKDVISFLIQMERDFLLRSE